MKIVLVLPTYNEKENIAKLITILEQQIFPKIKRHSFRILVIDDRSPDGTAETVKKLMKKWKNISLISGKKRGLGNAYHRGISYAIDKMKAEILISMDVDGQHDPRVLPKFLKKIKDSADMVIGSRYMKGGSVAPEWKFYRKYASILGNKFTGAVLGNFSIHEWTTSYRAFRKDVFLKERIKIAKFSGNTFLPAMLYEALLDGFKVTEIPIHFAARGSGKSKTNPPAYAIELIKYMLKKRLS